MQILIQIEGKNISKNTEELTYVSGKEKEKGKYNLRQQLKNVRKIIRNQQGQKEKAIIERSEGGKEKMGREKKKEMVKEKERKWTRKKWERGKEEKDGKKEGIKM